jgi:soluble lytic murein transglycosylase-like protein
MEVKQNNPILERRKDMIRLLCLVAAIALFFHSQAIFLASMPIPVSISRFEIDPITVESKNSLIVAGAPRDRIAGLTKAVANASKSENIPPLLITVLMKSESNYNKKAISPSGKYKGEMQTPTSTEFSDVNILYGAKILREKLNATNNNMLNALTLYKGGNNSEARSQAQHVLNVYERLQPKLKVLMQKEV